MEHRGVTVAGADLQTLHGAGLPPEAGSALKRALAIVPDPEASAVVRTLEGMPFLLLLAGGALYMAAIQAVGEDFEAQAAGGHAAVVSRVPLDPTTQRVVFCDYWAEGPSSTAIRRWSFEFGRLPLVFETSTDQPSNMSPAENFARKLAGALGWPDL